MKYLVYALLLMSLVFMAACTTTSIPNEVKEIVTENMPPAGKTTEFGDVVQETNGVKHIVDLDKVLVGCLGGKDCIPSIDNPKFESLEVADEWLNDEDIIFGANLNGIQRAYPQRILNWHEIVNDDFGGKPIAVTFCPLWFCNSV